MKNEMLALLALLSMIGILCTRPVNAFGADGIPLGLTFSTASAMIVGVNAASGKASPSSKNSKGKKLLKSSTKPSAKKTEGKASVKASAQGPKTKEIALSPKSPQVVNMNAGGDYTGLIIDATGLKIERSMSPKIRRTDGSVIWAGDDANPDFVIDKGIVGYAINMSAAKSNPRAGVNPLIIHAVARYNGDNFHSDPEITIIDANLLLQAASKDGFLKKFNVIFMIN